MTENDAKAWLRVTFGEQAFELLATFADAVIDENGRQNLIAPSTVASIWSRHILDSAQLVPLAPADGIWLDIGAGAGFPGIVAAILRRQPTILVEPRRRRVAFLDHCARLLQLAHVDIRPTKVEMIGDPVSVISARAVASVEKLLQAGSGCATKATRWLLPRGSFREAELHLLRSKWGGMFHMKQSLSDPASTILICDGPCPR